MATADRMFYAGLDLLFSDEQARGYGIADCSSLSISTKVHLYQALVMSVRLNGAETWTLLVADMNTLEVFHMTCQRQILDICRWVHVSNVEVLQRSGLSTIGDILGHRRLSLFGHVARRDPGVPAHNALRLMQKANGQLEKTARPPWQRLAQQGSGGCQC